MTSTIRNEAATADALAGTSTGVRSGSVTPVIPGFYPDPTICKVGDDYYLANSSFEYFPGAPIFHSTDLTSWTQIGNILDRRTQFRHGTDLPSTGIYGATLRFHEGRFWFITTNVSDFDGGQLIVSAEDPSGPWSDPVFVADAKGIDPDLCWDDDGACYLTWNALDFVTEGRGIRQARLDLETGELLGADYPIWQGTGLLAPEGPHLYQIGGYWYLVLAEGGTERGHCVTVARGASPAGPFESCPWNPAFTHRSTGHAVQNVGHADLVEAADGTWAAVYLAVRPEGPTPGFHVLGRETFLAGVDWLDGWPVFDESRFEFEPASTGFTEDFSEPDLALRWLTPMGEPTAVVLRRESGGVSFTGWKGQPSELLCARVRDLRWVAEAEFVGSGRMQLRLDDRHWFEIAAHAGRIEARARVGDLEQSFGASRSETEAVTLLISAEDAAGALLPFGHAGPDDIVLSFREGDDEHELARLDGRYLSTEVVGGFTGRMLGLGATDAGSVLRTFSYRPV